MYCCGILRCIEAEALNGGLYHGVHLFTIPLEHIIKIPHVGNDLGNSFVSFPEVVAWLVKLPLDLILLKFLSQSVTY